MAPCRSGPSNENALRPSLSLTPASRATVSAPANEVEEREAKAARPVEPVRNLRRFIMNMPNLTFRDSNGTHRIRAESSYAYEKAVEKGSVRGRWICERVVPTEWIAMGGLGRARNNLSVCGV